MNRPRPHQNAVPVEMTTGETVAALCPDCDTQLSAAWLHCEDPAPINVTMLEDPPGSRFICHGCGNVYGVLADPNVIEV